MFDPGALSGDDLRAFAETTELELGPDGQQTAFTIDKMPARKAHRVWRETVHALGTSNLFPAIAAAVAANDSSDDTSAGLHVVRGLLTLDPDFLDGIQAKIFEYVRYTNANARSLQKVEGAEDTAFEHLEPFDVDEVFIRAFAVNFTPSLLKIGSKVLATGQDQSSPNPSD
ncbi:MAG: hypothetical protein F4Y02_13685 [Chloroflexi bacterium]|nr:hypothetical protein [Chloroflexota bacterium]